MDMTLDVMAHSLVYWMQDLVAGGFLPEGAHVFAMTSAGGHRIWKSYGAVSAAKAALESHCRQLAVELVTKKIAVNAIRAGVTDTPALRKIPGNDADDRALPRDSPGGPADDPGRRRERPRRRCRAPRPSGSRETSSASTGPKTSSAERAMKPNAVSRAPSARTSFSPSIAVVLPGASCEVVKPSVEGRHRRPVGREVPARPPRPPPREGGHGRPRGLRGGLGRRGAPRGLPRGDRARLSRLAPPPLPDRTGPARLLDQRAQRLRAARRPALQPARAASRRSRTGSTRKPTYVVGGRNLSLNAMTAIAYKRFTDARVHFALVKARRGGPPLEKEALGAGRPRRAPRRRPPAPSWPTRRNVGLEGARAQGGSFADPHRLPRGVRARGAVHGFRGHAPRHVAEPLSRAAGEDQRDRGLSDPAGRAAQRRGEPLARCRVRVAPPRLSSRRSRSRAGPRAREEKPAPRRVAGCRARRSALGELPLAAGLVLALDPNLPGVDVGDVPESTRREVEVLEFGKAGLRLRWSGRVRIEKRESARRREDWVRAQANAPRGATPIPAPPAAYESREVGGTLFFPDFATATEFLLPGLWPEGVATIAGSSALWISTNAFAELKAAGRATVPFSLSSSALRDPAASLLKRALPALGRGRVRASARLDAGRGVRLSAPRGRRRGAREGRRRAQLVRRVHRPRGGRAAPRPLGPAVPRRVSGPRSLRARGRPPDAARLPGVGGPPRAARRVLTA